MDRHVMPIFVGVMIVCLIPAFRAANSIAEVVAGALAVVDRVIVIDDACPQESGLVVATKFAAETRVEVLRHQANRGVGGAMKTGIRRALDLGADVIVKLDADGQMDPAHIAPMVQALEMNPRLVMIKGNRFFDGSVSRLMPGIRLFGNSVLTLLVRATTGYWNAIDPTNGFLVIRSAALRRVKLDALADRFFFEISLLTAFGIEKLEIAEFAMLARYGSEVSNLSISKVVWSFPMKLLGSFARRIVWQYLVSDMNIGSLFLVFGVLLSALGSGVGTIWWIQALQSGIPRTPGTVTLALVPLIMGFQLILNAVLYDVQSATRVYKFSAEGRFDALAHGREAILVR